MNRDYFIALFIVTAFVVFGAFCYALGAMSTTNYAIERLAAQ